MPDITIRCVSCKTDFVHTEKDQAFFDRMGFTEKPKRCRACRAKRKQQQEQDDQT